MVFDHICTGGIAFPHFPSDAGKYGLSIADYFAAHAISGIMANPNTVMPATTEALEELAQTAYQIGCSMVELRENTPVETTPVPLEPLEPVPEVQITAADAVVKLGNRPPSPLPREYAPQKM